MTAWQGYALPGRVRRSRRLEPGSQEPADVGQQDGQDDHEAADGEQ